MRKCTLWARCSGTGTRSRSSGTCRALRRGTCGSRRLALPSRRVGPVPTCVPPSGPQAPPCGFSAHQPSRPSPSSFPLLATDTLALRTTAVRAADGTHYVVNGQKVWTSRAEHSDLMLLLARTGPRGDGAQRTAGLSVFLVDMPSAVAVRNGMGHPPRTIRPLGP